MRKSAFLMLLAFVLFIVWAIWMNHKIPTDSDEFYFGVSHNHEKPNYYK